jgi:hypothetical protein
MKGTNTRHKSLTDEAAVRIVIRKGVMGAERLDLDVQKMFDS